MRWIPFFLLAVLIAALPAPEKGLGAAELKTALFSGGNFWSLQHVFDSVPGVTNTVAGYTGGEISNPAYTQVAHEKTGHRMAVLVSYDPKLVSYRTLLGIYWRNVDPVDAGGQFCDRGHRFTPAIYYFDKAQRAEAEDTKMLLEADSVRMGGRDTVIPVLPAQRFYAAESHHQHYDRKNPLRFAFYSRYCGREERLYQVWGPPRISARD